MGTPDVTTLRTLRDYLVKRGDGVKVRRRSPDHQGLRQRLDETLLAFRTARKLAESDGVEGHGWLRTVRKATGVPSDVLAKRLGVERPEVFRLERTERESRIMLANLERAAEALGCELVYALVPRKGSLEDLAEAECLAREEAVEEAEIRDQRSERPGIRELVEHLLKSAELAAIEAALSHPCAIRRA